MKKFMCSKVFLKIFNFLQGPLKDFLFQGMQRVTNSLVQPSIWDTIWYMMDESSNPPFVNEKLITSICSCLKEDLDKKINGKMGISPIIWGWRVGVWAYLSFDVKSLKLFHYGKFNNFANTFGNTSFFCIVYKFELAWCFKISQNGGGS